MQRKRRPREREEQGQVVHRERLSLEDGLHEGHVDEPELRQERDRDGDEQHPVLRQSAPEPAVLDRRDEVEKDEARERLSIEREIRHEGSMRTGMRIAAYHRLVAARHVVVIRERKVVDEQGTSDDDGRRKYDAHQDTLIDDRLILLPWRLPHHGAINRVNPK